MVPGVKGQLSLGELLDAESVLWRLEANDGMWVNDAVFLCMHVLTQHKSKVLLPGHEFQLDVARGEYVLVLVPIVLLTLQGRERHCRTDHRVRLQSLPSSQLCCVC